MTANAVLQISCEFKPKHQIYRHLGLFRVRMSKISYKTGQFLVKLSLFMFGSTFYPDTVYSALYIDARSSGETFANPKTSASHQMACHSESLPHPKWKRHSTKTSLAQA